MSKPPTGPLTKAEDPNVCVGEEKACGLCRNCTIPQANPFVSEPTYNCPKHRTNDHAEGSLLCWSQVASYYSNQAKPSDILDQVKWYCSEHQTSYSNCEKWKLQHRDEVNKLNDQRLDSAYKIHTLESELPRTYALGIQIIGDTHYSRCNTRDNPHTFGLDCPLLKLWLQMVDFEAP